MLLPAVSEGQAHAEQLTCIRNLKHIGLAFRVFAKDHGDKYPYNVPGLRLYDPNAEMEGQGGNPLLYKNGDTETWRNFQTLSNELKSSKILLCPADRRRETNEANEANDFLQTRDSLSGSVKRNLAVSYFIGLEASEVKAQSILAGDRNIAGPTAIGPCVDQSEPALPGGVYLFGPNDSRGARRRFSDHPNNPLHESTGHILLGDGSVTEAYPAGLEHQLSLSLRTYGTNAWLFAFPNDP
jgi:hypothetical protein